VVGGDVRIAVANPRRLTHLEAYESIFAYRQQEYIETMGFSGTGNLAVGREDFERIGPFAGIEVAEDRDWGRRACGPSAPVLTTRPSCSRRPSSRYTWLRVMFQNRASDTVAVS